MTGGAPQSCIAQAGFDQTGILPKQFLVADTLYCYRGVQ